MSPVAIFRSVASVAKKEFLHIREKDLEHHFENEDKGGEQGGSNKEEKKEKSALVKPEEALKNDYQAMRALDLLKGWEILKTMGTEK